MNNLNKTQAKLRELGIEDDNHVYFNDDCANLIYEKFGGLIRKRRRDQQLIYLLNKMLSDVNEKGIKRIDKFKIAEQAFFEEGADGKKFIIDNKEKLIEFGFELDKDLRFDEQTQDANYYIIVLKRIAKFYGYKAKRKDLRLDLHSRGWVSYYVISDPNDLSDLIRGDTNQQDFEYNFDHSSYDYYCPPPWMTK